VTEGLTMPTTKKRRNPNARAIVHLDGWSKRGKRLASNWADTWSDNFDHLVSESKAMLLPGHFSLTRLVRMSTTMTMNVYATMLGSCEDLYGDGPSGARSAKRSVKLSFDETFQTTDPVFVKVPRDATEDVKAGELKFNDKSIIPDEHVKVRLEDKGIISVKLAGLGKIIKNLAPGEYCGNVTVKLKTGKSITVTVTATYARSESAEPSKEGVPTPEAT
jgi:hypothetical protein